ncbi:MAG: Clas68 [Betabaculovirus sp.]|nr:MAG: Clas68 [Betabaculovirus sp.]
MLNTNVSVVCDLLHSLSDDALIHDVNKTATLRALKHLWCYAKCYNYNLLQHFVKMLDANELPDFVKKVTNTHNDNNNNTCTTPMWVFDNTHLFNTHRTQTPDLFIWLQNYCTTTPTNNNNNTTHKYTVDDVINVLGEYCVVTTTSKMIRIVGVVFVQKSRHDFFKTLRAQLLNANILHSPPLRNDVCYRFTQFVQKVRDTVRIH